ncbi:MAG: hypothetical protein ACRDN9_04930 [Streptosporangiaceae bacterium]
MIHLLRVTAFNLPRSTRLSGATLIVLVGVVHLWVFTHSTAPGYVIGLFLAASVGSFLAVAGLLAGFRGVSWKLGAAISGLCFVGYVVSRAIGLPSFSAAVGAWHSPLGTVGLVLEALLLALYVSLLVGWNVDAPGQRDWDTYFSLTRR